MGRVGPDGAPRFEVFGFRGGHQLRPVDAVLVVGRARLIDVVPAESQVRSARVRQSSRDAKSITDSDRGKEAGDCPR